MTDKPDAGEAARRLLAITSPKEQGVSYVYDGDRRRADMQLVASDWLAQAKRIAELEKALRAWGANARLIAAAPDLLAALVGVMKARGGLLDAGAADMAALAAIGKAQGE